MSGDAFQSALSSNKAWADSVSQSDPSFFPESAKGQSPQILWIGCSDSRVPETTILGLKPGDVFTHRNIANILTPTDLSSLAAIEFSVAHLKVKHIVVCGHTSCGGVNATLGNAKLGILDPWLHPMREVRARHVKELEGLQGEKKSLRLSQLNVLNSLDVVRRNATVIEAVKQRGLKLHGVVYNLATGKLEVVDEEQDEASLKKRLESFDLSQG